MQRPQGDPLAFEQVWELSKLWYADRLSPDFKGRSLAEARRIFEELGLRSRFWQIEESG